MTEPGTAISSVEIVEVLPRLAAVVRRQVGYAEMGEAQRRAHPLLEAAMRAANVEADGPRLTVWRRLDGGLVDYAPGVFIPRPIADAGEVSLLTLPAGHAAHLRLTGPYASLPTAWRRLFEACEGRELSGLNWEIYATSDANEPETDLFAMLT